MSMFRRAKELSGDLAAASKRQAQRGKIELDLRRLEGKVDDEKNAIGQAIFPLLEAGTLQVDAPEVHEHLNRIAELNAEIVGKRAEVDALGHEADSPAPAESAPDAPAPPAPPSE